MDRVGIAVKGDPHRSPSLPPSEDTVKRYPLQTQTELYWDPALATS